MCALTREVLIDNTSFIPHKLRNGSAVIFTMTDLKRIDGYIRGLSASTSDTIKQTILSIAKERGIR